MIGELVLTYECGDVDFRVYRWPDGNHTYFLRVGAAGVELTKETAQQMFDVIEGARDDSDFMEAFL